MLQATADPQVAAVPQRASGFGAFLIEYRAWIGVLLFAVLLLCRFTDEITASWWLLLIPLWIIPWQSRLRSSEGHPPPFVALTAPPVLAGVFYALQTGTADAFNTWTVFADTRWGPVFSFPLQALLSGCVTAAVSAAPTCRIMRRYAVATAFLAGLPFFIHAGMDDFFHLRRWQHHRMATEIDLFSALIPILLWAEASSLLNRWNARRYRAQPSAMQGFYHHWRDGLWHPALMFFGVFAGSIGLFFVAFRIYAGHAGLWSQSASGSVALFVLFASSLIVLFISTIGTWVNLDRLKHQGTRQSFLAQAAQFSMILALAIPAIVTVGYDAMMTGTYLTNGIRALPVPLWTVKVQGDRIIVSGEFERGLANAFKDAIDAHPEVRQVELNSPGGLISESLAMAKEVSERRLDTLVREHCASACTDVFISGAKRELLPDALLGFHSTAPSAWYGQYDSVEYPRYLKQRGITPLFIDHVSHVPADNMWFPTRRELLAAHVLQDPKPGP
jgi:hypothetical protein